MQQDSGHTTQPTTQNNSQRSPYRLLPAPVCAQLSAAVLHCRNCTHTVLRNFVALCDESSPPRHAHPLLPGGPPHSHTCVGEPLDLERSTPAPSFMHWATHKGLSPQHLLAKDSLPHNPSTTYTASARRSHCGSLSALIWRHLRRAVQAGCRLGHHVLWPVQNVCLALPPSRLRLACVPPPQCYFCVCAALPLFASFLPCPAVVALAAAATALQTCLCCFQCLLWSAAPQYLAVPHALHLLPLPAASCSSEGLSKQQQLGSLQQKRVGSAAHSRLPKLIRILPQSC